MTWHGRNETSVIPSRITDASPRRSKHRFEHGLDTPSPPPRREATPDAEMRRLRITRGRFLRQGRLALFTLAGHERFDLIDAFRRQQLAQMRLMPGLAAASSFRLLLDDGLL